MTVFLIGDNRATLRALPANSVNCCVTSPPYYGLRDYNVLGQIGQEASVEEYIAEIVAVFREIHRILKDDGVAWLNLGDTYARNPKKGRSGTPNGRNLPQQGYPGGAGVPLGLKEKDIIGIPWRVAFALQADGWYLRQDIIWHKPNPMPEPTKDRFVKSHEYIFLLTKSPRYYFDYLAVREDATCFRLPGRGMTDTKATYGAQNGGNSGLASLRKKLVSQGHTDPKRNRRSVWTVTTKPFKGAHFATYPPDLIEPCIIAGCPEGGTVIDPFGGSGTTAWTAKKLGRKAILCELNPDYMRLAIKRVLPPGLSREMALCALEMEVTSKAIGLA